MTFRSPTQFDRYIKKNLSWMMINEYNLHIYIIIHCISWLILFININAHSSTGVMYIAIFYILFTLQNAFVGVVAIVDSMFYSKGKDLKRAGRSLQKAFNRGADHHLIYNNLAYIHARLIEDIEYGIELAQKALDRKPNNAAYIDTYGWLLTLKGEYKKGNKFLIDAHRKKPENIIIMFHLGYSYLKTSEKEKGVVLLNKCWHDKNESLFTKEEWEILKSLVFRQDKQSNKNTFFNRYREYKELIYFDSTISLYTLTLFYAFLIMIFSTALLLNSKNVYFQFNEIINSLNASVTGYDMDPKSYTIFYTAYFYIFGLAAFLAIRIIFFLAKVFLPSRYLPPLIISGSLLWSNYKDNYRKKQSFRLFFIIIFFILFGIYFVPLFVNIELPLYFGKAIRVLFISVVVTNSIYFLMNNYYQKYIKSNPLYTDDLISKNAILETIDITYLVIIGIIVITYIFPLAPKIINLFDMGLLTLPEKFGLNKVVYELSGKVFLNSDIPDLFIKLSESGKELLPLFFHLPIILSSIMILGGGFIYWGFRKTFTIIIICISSLMFTLLFEFIIANKVYNLSRNYNFGLPQLTVFLITILISLYAAPSKIVSKNIKLTDIDGIGPANEKILNEIGITSVEDLLTFNLMKYKLSLDHKDIIYKNKKLFNEETINKFKIQAINIINKQA
jgi:tetratricopeptide (TPR) repeat protein